MKHDVCWKYLSLYSYGDEYIPPLSLALLQLCMTVRIYSSLSNNIFCFDTIIFLMELYWNSGSLNCILLFCTWICHCVLLAVELFLFRRLSLSPLALAMFLSLTNQFSRFSVSISDCCTLSPCVIQLDAHNIFFVLFS